MDITHSLKNYSNSQRIPVYKQESMLKYISNRTITETSEDNISIKYFNQDPDEKNNMDLDCEKKYYIIDSIKSDKTITNHNGNINGNFVVDILEHITSKNDHIDDSSKNILCKEKKQNKENYVDNSDNDCSSKELFEKTHAEMLSNDSINEKNNKSNMEYILNLNENNDLRLSNAELNNQNTNQNESMKMEAEKSNDQNQMNKNSIANRRRGRQRKNIRNKKDELKTKDDSSNQAKTGNEYVGTISKKIFTENAWVHLSCALWLPEVLIDDFEKKENIKSNFNKILIF